MLRKKFMQVTIFAFFALSLPLGAFAEVNLLNVSYDPTLELYQDFDRIYQKGR